MRFKKVISVVLVIVVIASCVTIPGAAKVSDKVQKCDFTIFAGSSDDDAILFNASNVCINGNIVKFSSDTDEDGLSDGLELDLI